MSSHDAPIPGRGGLADRWPSRWLWGIASSPGLTLLLVVVGVAALLSLGGLAGGGCTVRVEFAGSGDSYRDVLTTCPTSSSAQLLALRWDLLYIACYGLVLTLLCAIGARAYGSGDARQAGTTRWAFGLAGWCVWVAVVLDVLENAFLLRAITLVQEEPGVADGWFAWTTGTATTKFVTLLAPVVAVAVVAVTAVCRVCIAVGHKALGRVKDDDVLWSVWPTAGPDDATISVNYSVPEVEPGSTGVCLSGGGIRAGVFAMGAVQSLAERGALNDVRYLSAVSGGGYFASAYQSLRHLAAKTGPADASTVAGAFSPRSPEENHVRRHGKYIADGARQWAAAVFVVLRNTAMSLALLYGVALVAAGLAAMAYTSTGSWAGRVFPEAGTESPQWGVWTFVAVGLPFGLGLILWVASGLLQPKWRNRVYSYAGCLAAIGIASAVAVVGVPALTAWVSDGTGGAGDATPATGGTGVGVAAVTAVVATVATAWNALTRSSQADGSNSALKSAASLWSKVASAASFAVRFLLTVGVVLAAVALAAIVFAAELNAALWTRRAGGGPWPSIIAAALLVLVYLAFDQTRMSLYPFYKRRLASAFAVQRRPDGTAVEPDYNTLSTLSCYGKPLNHSGTEDTKGMQVLLCAAAHVSGQSMAPSGRRVVPFVFSYDYVGGPTLGYVKTDDLEQLTAGKLHDKVKPKKRLARTYNSDITLLSASAISGSAFASSMGRGSGPFDLLLALSNARLGAWLPNPHYHWQRRNTPTDLPAQEDRRGALPWMRRLGYFAREILGVYSVSDRFIYVTDGGHYENLGLVELLRRRCTLIYCIDASGDHSLAHTLAQAAALAYEELGVEITVEGTLLSRLSATTGTDDNADLKALHQRLTGRAVVAGTFTYAARAGAEGAHGRLIVGKAGLGEDINADPRMFPLLTYAAAHPEFPEDSTADQWFDADQFQSYLTLGRVVGDHMKWDTASVNARPRDRRRRRVASGRLGLRGASRPPAHGRSAPSSG